MIEVELTEEEGRDMDEDCEDKEPVFDWHELD